MLLRTMILLAGAALVLVGCSSPEGGSPAPHAPSSHDHASGASASGDVAPEMKMNRECPVMGDEIDPEIFADHDGRRVYFCCDSCVQEFREDPERYVAKAYPYATNR